MQGKASVYLLIFAFAGSVALLFSAYQFIYKPQQAVEKPSIESAAPGKMATESEHGWTTKTGGAETASCPTVKSVTLLPEQPTMHDNITAKVTFDQETKADVKLSYKWFVNNKPVENVVGDSLPAGRFKKNDWVFVDVTPSIEDKQGFTCRSAFRSIYSTPITLRLKETKDKVGDIINLQLAANDPDGAKIAYELEQPILSGMTVDRESGRIAWQLSKREVGRYKFTASASTPDGRKTTKTFEFSLDVK